MRVLLGIIADEHIQAVRSLVDAMKNAMGCCDVAQCDAISSRLQDMLTNTISVDETVWENMIAEIRKTSAFSVDFLPAPRQLTQFLIVAQNMGETEFAHWLQQAEGHAVLQLPVEDDSDV